MFSSLAAAATTGASSFFIVQTRTFARPFRVRRRKHNLAARIHDPVLYLGHSPACLAAERSCCLVAEAMLSEDWKPWAADKSCANCWQLSTTPCQIGTFASMNLALISVTPPVANHVARDVRGRCSQSFNPFSRPWPTAQPSNDTRRQHRHFRPQHADARTHTEVLTFRFP